MSNPQLDMFCQVWDEIENEVDAMDKLTDIYHKPETAEQWADSFGPTSWNDLCNDIAVSLAFGGKQPSKRRVAEIVIEIAEAEGQGSRIPQEIRNWLTENIPTEEEEYLDRIGA